MAASPVLLNPSAVYDLHPRRAMRAKLSAAWVPALCAIVFVCFTSTNFMGGTHTQVVVDAVWKMVFGNWHSDLRGLVNGDGRKVGHFFGYGVIGLIFARAWFSSLRSRVSKANLSLVAMAFGIGSTFILASLDELHQAFLPWRVGSLHDVLLDTCGAICLNLVVLAYRSRRRAVPARATRTTVQSEIVVLDLNPPTSRAKAA